ncbi:MAG: DUF1289 domain-containing protein [Motiliproteus sp.]|nr:DUF1289 domain-containing protein [Motiliproteus sp.]MCW9052412.1 DUF1289 domain-containing protein [Motiliproteus sp.]
MAEPQTVPSPCIGVCALNEEDECIACGRNVVEIGDWGVLDAEQRQAVLDRIDRKQKGKLV